MTLFLVCLSKHMDTHMLSVWNTSGSLHDPKGDGNKNNKKNNRFNKQNNNFARASPFFVHFFAINYCYTTTT